ncbi:hypothetical protein APS56_01575 [Pseudalgibacter alginicilyticus]|uniref:Uncharacterized protein n=1 Tax=Pseudalgibacter alginicilyticus TaxID=1736674 RepID=A0A0N7HY06_9FLAO|nr:hypothetical protein [Pseudalgibacter alginicilyticus]ALJ03918.1 hypothetical protein APS56_01575 [Pseudalgibacter alginicilyticus]
MAKKSKKTFKIIVGVIIFFTLPSLLLFGFVYFKYNETLPVGIQGEQADILAKNMLDALNFEVYNNTNYIEWTFKNRHHYKWQKNKNICSVYWKDYKVILTLNNLSQSKAYIHSFKTEGKKAAELIDTAIKYFNNDSFWLVAPYKIFDDGVQRALVKDENGNDALLITYTQGGSTPGDSYLWLLDKNNKPKSFKMWVSILPIGGLEATWNNWTTTESGAVLPTFHKMLFLGIEMNHIHTSK